MLRIMSDANKVSQQEPPDDSTDAVDVPIDGCLDLHTFNPKDLGDLIPDYIEACIEAGLTECRIVHGKGTGALRKSVHAILERLETVESFKMGGDARGQWGATLVELGSKTEA